MSFNRISWTAALLCGAVAFAGNAMAQSGATPQARVTQTTTSPAAPQPRFDIWADGTVRPHPADAAPFDIWADGTVRTRAPD